jgi:hypothetical protein
MTKPLTVRELIRELALANPELEVGIRCENGGGMSHPITTVRSGNPILLQANDRYDWSNELNSFKRW